MFIYFHSFQSWQMVEKLCREKADMNVKSNTGHTPLHIMQEKGRADCLMELLCWGADPSIGDDDGNTPLHIAVIVRFCYEHILVKEKSRKRNRFFVDEYIWCKIL